MCAVFDLEHFWYPSRAQGEWTEPGMSSGPDSLDRTPEGLDQTQIV